MLFIITVLFTAMSGISSAKHSEAFTKLKPTQDYTTASTRYTRFIMLHKDTPFAMVISEVPVACMVVDCSHVCIKDSTCAGFNMATLSDDTCVCQLVSEEIINQGSV